MNRPKNSISQPDKSIGHYITSHTIEMTERCRQAQCTVYGADRKRPFPASTAADSSVFVLFFGDSRQNKKLHKKIMNKKIQKMYKKQGKSIVLLVFTYDGGERSNGSYSQKWRTI